MPELFPSHPYLIVQLTRRSGQTEWAALHGDYDNHNIIAVRQDRAELERWCDDDWPRRQRDYVDDWPGNAKAIDLQE